MRLADLTYRRVSYMGDWVDSFDINARYHGYTRDRQLFFVYDENTNSYTDYTAASLDAALQSGYFTGSGSVNNNQTQQQNENGVTYFVPNSEGWGFKEYFFVAAGFGLLAYLAWEGTR